MKITYVEAADTWVISRVSKEKIDEANKIANRFNGHGIKAIVVPDDFELEIGSQPKTWKTANGIQKIVPPISQQYQPIPPAKTHEQKVARDLRIIANTIEMMKGDGRYAVLNQEDVSLDIGKLYELLNASGINTDMTSTYGNNTIQRKELTIRYKKEDSL